MTRLRAQGIEPTADEIILLYEVGKGVLAPPGLTPAALMDLPVLAGNVWLYRLSIGAQMWLEHVALPILDGAADSRHYVLAEAYAAAHARDPSTLVVCTTFEALWGGIKAWSLTIAASFKELDTALESLRPAVDVVEELDAVEHKPFDDLKPWEVLEWERRQAAPDAWGPVIGALMMGYQGTTAEYWMWDVSMERASQAVRELAERKRAAEGTDAADPSAPAMKAQRAMIKATQAITAAHAAREPAEGTVTDG